MTSLKTVPRFVVYAVSTAVRHPRTPISYYYCPDCGVNIPGNAAACPSCGHLVGHSPEARKTSPIPWWGAVLVMIVGIASWVTGAWLNITGLDEAGRALVYIPLGSLFGMSITK